MEKFNAKKLPFNKRAGLKRELVNMNPKKDDVKKYKDFKTTKKGHKRAVKVAKNHGISIEEALARTSSLPPTRLALVINKESLLELLQSFATLMSYAIQHKGSIPRFNSSSTQDAWSPSLIYAYLISITTSFLMRCGALETSSSFQVMGECNLPTFIAKWLQQMGPITHCGRRVVPTLNTTSTDLLSTDCGVGGLDLASGSGGASGFANAPCFVGGATPADKEGWWSVLGNGTQTPIIPANVTSDEYSKISSIVSQTFPHVVQVSKIPTNASTPELKITPVAPGIYGDLMYSCVDSKNMIDLVLPLCSFYTNSLINSPDSVQVAAPVRIDGGLCVSPESKIALLFHLANKHVFKPQDSFKKYLRHFGLSDTHMGNAVINLRQINWIQIIALCMQYASSQTTLDVSGFWYLVNYLVTVILSNIPGEFRAISPFQRSFSVAPLYKDTSAQPQYASFTKNPKIPPFVAQIVKCLREPIRYENQITFYISVLPSAGDPNWWSNVATNNGNHLGSNQNYGKIPSVLSETALVWNVSQNPYPSSGTTSTTVPGYNDCQRNYCALNGIGPVSDYLARNLTSLNGNQNLWNQWNAAAVNFTRRHGKYYVVSGIDADTMLYYPTKNDFNINPAVGKLVMSFEPATRHTASLALCNLMGYFSPSDDTVPTVGPVFSARPTQASTSSAVVAMSAANPGQGTAQQIQVAASGQPQEVQSRLAGESVEGSLTDKSEEPEPASKDKVIEMLKSKTKTVAEDTLHAGENIVSSAIKSIIA